jgi:ribose 5-phosphate isomerase B
MKIMIACDHAGLELKEKLVRHLKKLGLDVNDIGTHDTSPVDYPQYAAQVARAVASGEAERGILVCGSGIGMCMTANRFIGVRAVQVSEPFSARMSRSHNDSNILCLGGRFVGEAMAFEITDVWLNEPFEGGRHQKRVDLIDGLAGKV